MSWQKVFELHPIEKQGQVYAFENALRVLDPRPATPQTVLEIVFNTLQNMGFVVNASVEAEHNLRAAIKAGWIKTPLCEVETVQNGKGTKQRYLFEGVEVEDLHPGKVRWYGARIREAYQKAIEIPDPN